jgi:hypothetical protein
MLYFLAILSGSRTKCYIIGTKMLPFWKKIFWYVNQLTCIGGKIFRKVEQ